MSREPAADAEIRSAAQAARWLGALVDVERRPDWPYKRFGLEPIRALLACVGHPERGLRAVHIAGSKGKGSTALMTEAILQGCGLRTGTFTSPHLERWTERFRSDGREVDGARLAAAVEALRPHVDALRAADPEHAPTFFDVTTAAAFWLFRDAQVDCAILEVGLGGRLDSTNVCEPAVTCVTSIELEHTDRLGDTLAAIAAEKAGILKPGVPAVLGALPAPALDVALRRAQQLEAPVARFGRDFGCELRSEDSEGLDLRVFDGPLDFELRLPVQGAPQAHNAALATACARRLLGAGVPPEKLADATRLALSQIALPARIEILSRRPLTIVDAAHTAASARALAAVLARLARPLHLVLSISSGKDTNGILDALLPHVRSLTLTRAEPTRSLEPAQIAALAQRVAPQLEMRVVPNPHLALRATREACRDDEALCVAGSVYLAGIARGVLREIRAPEK